MISLSKGQRISLKKDNGTALNKICVGVNWGAITSKGIFGGSKLKSVDLDASIAVYDESGTVIELVSFSNLSAKGIKHSGDDRTGDAGDDDGLDNEVIQINLSELDSRAMSLGLILNSYNKVDFKEIPFASARIYSGTPDRVDEIHATLDIANDPKFSGAICMIMGVFYNKNNEWKFRSIGEPTKDNSLKELVDTVSREYL